MNVTTEEIKSALTLLSEVAKAIRDAGQTGIVSGHLYATLCGVMSLETYQTMLEKLFETGLVRIDRNVLYWVNGK